MVDVVFLEKDGIAQVRYGLARLVPEVNAFVSSPERVLVLEVTMPAQDFRLQVQQTRVSERRPKRTEAPTTVNVLIVAIPHEVSER